MSLHGSLARPNTVTVYKLNIAGVQVASVGNDFGQFDVTLPLTTLQSLGTNPVLLDGSALDNCSDGPTSVTINPNSLMLMIPSPAAPSILPASGILLPQGSVSATIDPHGGAITSCNAAATPGVTVTVAGVNVLAGWVGEFHDPKPLVIDAANAVLAVPPEDTIVSATIACQDSLGRSVTATYSTPN